MYIWGAGVRGRKALNYYGKRVDAVIDNSIEKQGTLLQGVRIISFNEYLSQDKVDGHILICASWPNVIDIQKQLRQYGINDYSVFELQLFENVDLICNEYEEFEGLAELDWYDSLRSNGSIEYVNKYVSSIGLNPPIFHEIEIETVNKCNGACTFCPVNRNRDIRKTEYMEEKLFRKIVEELSSIDYAGRIALFSNNEPLLDKRIVYFSKYLRNKLTKSHIHMFTNGTLLSIKLFDELIQYLDELIIDNYNQDLMLISPVEEIKKHIEKMGDKNIRKKVKILLRKPNEFLSSRGGDAPNRTVYSDVSMDKCALPFCQMIVRPSGKVSLCCNDPYGKETLGDLNNETILDVWYGEKYKMIRSKLMKGRKEMSRCNRCDTFMII